MATSDKDMTSHKRPMRYISIDYLERIDIRRARLPSVVGASDYDPLEHRDPPKPIKPWMAYLNFWRTLVGPGMLMMPLAISEGGIVLGPFLTFGVGVLLVYTNTLLANTNSLFDLRVYILIPHGFAILAFHFYVTLMRNLHSIRLIVRKMLTKMKIIIYVPSLLTIVYVARLYNINKICRLMRVPHVSYRYSFRLAVLHGPPLFHCIGNHGPALVAMFSFLSQLGICTVYVILACHAVRDVTDWESILPSLMFLLTPYLVLQFFMKSLYVVSYVSFVGNFLNFLGLLILLTLFFVKKDNTVNVTPVPPDLRDTIRCLGISFFNLSAVPVTLAVDKDLKDPRILTTKFGVINVGIILPTIISIIFGVCGYWSFGAMEENVLRSLQLDEEISMITYLMFLLSIALAYPIQCYPAIAMIMEVIKYHDPFAEPNAHTLKIVETVSRVTFVCVTFLIAYLLPYQGAFVAFVGNLCVTMVALVFPALMDTCLRYPDHYGRYAIHLFKCMFIICLGLLVCAYGIYFCCHVFYIRIMSTYSPNTDFV